VCDDKASTDECGQRMGAWVQAKQFPNFVLSRPQIIEGEGVFTFTAEQLAARA